MKKLVLLIALLIAAPLWAAGEIQLDNVDTGQTVYLVLKNQSGDALTTGTTFATYTTTRADFDQSLGEVGVTGLFTYNFPAVTAGSYNWTIYQDSNDDATPSHTDDISLATGSGFWNGTAFGADVVALLGTAPVPHTAGWFPATIKDGAGTGEIDTNLGRIENVNSVAVVSTLNAMSAGAITLLSIGSDARIGVDWSKVSNPTTTLSLTGTTISSSQAVTITGATVTAANVDDDHTWRFDSPTSQVTAPNSITEIAGAASVLVAMDFDEPLPANSSIASITSVTVADVAGATEPTVTGSSIHTAKRKVIIDTNTSAATAATYTYSVKILSTDSQSFTRKGRLVLPY